MKTRLLAFLAIATLAFSSPGRAQAPLSWATLGQPLWANAYVSSALDSAGTPYLVIGEAPDVVRWNGRAWQALGAPGQYPGNDRLVSIAMDPWNRLYVATGGSAGAGISVYRWDGRTWAKLGAIDLYGEHADFANELVLALDRRGNPYVAYTAGNHEPMDVPDGPGAGLLTVVRWNGSQWVAVGQDIAHSEVEYPSLAIDSRENVYVGFNDSTTGQPEVLSWNGRAWASISSPAFRGRDAGYHPQMAVNSRDELYFAFPDFSVGSQGVDVFRWTGTSWSQLASPGSGGRLSLQFDRWGYPLVTVSVPGSSFPRKALRRWNGSLWETLGDPITDGVYRLLDTSMSAGPSGQVFMTYSYWNTADPQHWGWALGRILR